MTNIPAMAYLCLLCREPGHKTADCLFKKPTSSAPPPSTVSVSLGQGSVLCQRCRELKILELLVNGDIRDELATEIVADAWGDDSGVSSGGDIIGHMNKRHNVKRYRNLGPFRDIVLSDSCPLCRLIFSVFPTGVSTKPENDYLLRPMRTYNRLGMGLTLGDVDEAVKKKYSVSISVGTHEDSTTNSSRFMGAPQDATVHLSAYSFALSSNNPVAREQGLPARVRDATVNIDVVKAWLHRCESEHHCHAEWSDDLLTTRMIDVESRTIVACPPHCRYTALSYVWGSIVPEDGALEKGTLPLTIEDAITLTKSLGIRYLWVDALCIDQRPSPQKLQQLSIMDLIYNGAYATIIALEGIDSMAGLRGVRADNPRQPQTREWIEGYELVTILPPLAQEIQPVVCKHSTRAWTTQELYLSTRRIFFGKDQMHYNCSTNCEESIDETIDPATIWERSSSNTATSEFENMNKLQKLAGHGPPSSNLRRRAGDAIFTEVVMVYTQRSMSNDSDSLNACLGMLSYLRRYFIPGGFIWGLPLKDLPQSLRWYHRRWVKPRRRKDFPSWSFVGWEGEASYTDGLDFEAGSRTEIRRFDVKVDMSVRFVEVEDKILTLEGYVATLEIRNEPFNDAYVPGMDVLVGMLQEGDVPHKNTLPPGVFEFVVVERLTYRHSPEGRVRKTLYLLMLGDEEGGIPTRRSMVRLYVDPDFVEAREFAKIVQKRDDIRMV